MSGSELASEFGSEFEERLYGQRLEKLAEIGRLGQAQGLSAAEATYPNSFRASTTIPELRAKYIDREVPVSAEELEASRVEATVCGALDADPCTGQGWICAVAAGWVAAADLCSEG